MGVVNGKLTQELVQRQEDHFNEQINKMVPSTFYRHFLKYVIGWFNRHLADNVTEEYKEEIYGVSNAFSDKYDYIGSQLPAQFKLPCRTRYWSCPAKHGTGGLYFFWYLGFGFRQQYDHRPQF